MKKNEVVNIELTVFANTVDYKTKNKMEINTKIYFQPPGW